MTIVNIALMHLFQYNILRRRVPPQRGIGGANLPHSLAVQVKRSRGGAPDGGLPHHQEAVARPGKMLIPGVLTRVEEAVLAAGRRIETRTTIPFAAITREAAEREILRGCLAARNERNHVLHRKLDILPLLGRVAVLTSPSRTQPDPCTQIGWDFRPFGQRSLQSRQGSWSSVPAG